MLQVLQCKGMGEAGEMFGLIEISNSARRFVAKRGCASVDFVEVFAK